MLSYARGPLAPLLEKTVDEVFRQTVARVPRSDALISRHQQIRYTYAELDRQVDLAARGLAGLGLEPGDRVGIWATNCAEWILIQLACARRGLVLVNVNPAYRSHELAFVLRKSRMRAIFVSAPDARADRPQILREASNAEKFALEHVVVLEKNSWDRFIAAGADRPVPAPSNQAVVNIQYTSGTTGSPKGVQLTHRNVVNNGLLGARQLGATERDRICVPVPLYHCFGCVIGTMIAITSGAAMIFPAAQFDPLATLEAVAAERASVVYGVPTMFIAELEHPEFARFDLGSLRAGIMAGAPCPIEVMRRVVDQMHCSEMVIAYGQTESSPIITMSAPDDPLDVRVSTIGKPIAETEVKIVSTVSGETVPVGEQGELCARGHVVMLGYDDEPEATRRAIDSEGWLHTGDLAAMRPDGCLRITGRAKDMIIRGGENVYPREVEEFFYTHPKIAEVQVVGLPDAKLGEAVCAWIRLKAGEAATEDEIRLFCSGKIAYYKIPQYIRLVDSFPTTVTGKIQKFKIREFETLERGLAHAARIETA